MADTSLTPQVVIPLVLVAGLLGGVSSRLLASDPVATSQPDGGTPAPTRFHAPWDTADCLDAGPVDPVALFDRYGRAIVAACVTLVPPDNRYCAVGGWVDYEVRDPDGTVAFTNTRCAGDSLNSVVNTANGNRPDWWVEPDAGADGVAPVGSNGADGKVEP